jgi:ATP-dependent DNA helicase 2 subunit 1
MLRFRAPNTSVKRLFLITDNDDPHPGQQQLFKTAQNTMFDLRQMGVAIQTFFISTDDHPFKVSRFYSVSNLI